MSGLPPGGALLQPLDTAAFDVIFLPATAGALTGSLTVGDRTYALTGISSPLPLPHPLLSIDVPKAASGQQGTVTIQFDSAARVAGDGTLTLDFQPLAKGAGDPAIQLGVVGRAASFAFAAGDTQAAFGDLAAVAFQTGTTAGTLTFTADIGGVTEQKTITIDPAPVTMFSAAGTRGSGSIELRIAGFDNTRSAGAVQYTFFDAAGNAIPPGAIVMDSTAIFAAYFGASDAGGQFELLSVFPVTGDASRIAAFEVEIANSAGKTGSGRQKL
jgi:hypothetical protein